ncbi:AraC family ligand binding domain-containing protein, partial [Vibrio fluvialis]|nr:AraC family ligand binding domain-containing protein [Vibrio fluvialis]
MSTSLSSNIMRPTALPQVEARIAKWSHVCYQKHSHDEFSFGIIDSGRARYDNHVRQHQIGGGDVVTINPADMHSCNPHEGEWSYRMLFVDTLWMGQMQQEVLGR